MSTPGTNPIASYTFDFGDGTTAEPQAGPTTSHSYGAGGNYTLKLTVTDTAGDTATANASVAVGAPVASLTLSPTSGASPLSVTANASASADPIGITSYTFNLGDGSQPIGPQAGSSAGHTYSAGGSYTVADATGASATATRTVLVGAPVAALTVTPGSGQAPVAAIHPGWARNWESGPSGYRF